MSVPLDRLYHYIESVANEVFGDVIIYRFWPHGSKKLENLQPLYLKDWYTSMTLPLIVCHDQEPLDFDSYANPELTPKCKLDEIRLKYDCLYDINIKRPTIFDQQIVLHSEQHSDQVDKYNKIGIIPVYYWCHAMIAQDWFRFAQHVTQRKNSKKTFLIYNRAWAGTREYRIKFAELLLDKNLLAHCKTAFNPTDPDTGVCYRNYQFKNLDWRPERDLEGHFESNHSPSSNSADFAIQDYELSDIEIVLETLFDDHRLHLTEKILRPIACAQPFILLATAGSLQYLRQYGFKTYNSVWDESYDTIQDPKQRMLAITQLMNQIVAWDPHTKQEKLNQARCIADFNKQHFFSSEFFDLISGELKSNLGHALKILVNSNTSRIWLEQRKKICQHQELKEIFIGRTPNPDIEQVSPENNLKDTFMKKSEILKVLHRARQYLDSTDCK